MTYRSLFRTVASRTSAPLLAAYIVDSTSYKKSSAAACEKPHADDIETTPKEDDTDFYHGMFPRRQLWKPKYEYPLWDRNWDQREPVEQDKQHARLLRKSGVTRHVILIRHGQYDETYKVRRGTETEEEEVDGLSVLTTCLSLSYIGRRKAQTHRLGQTPSRIYRPSPCRDASRRRRRLFGLSLYQITCLQHDSSKRNGRDYCQTLANRGENVTRSTLERRTSVSSRTRHTRDTQND